MIRLDSTPAGVLLAIVAVFAAAFAAGVVLHYARVPRLGRLSRASLALARLAALALVVAFACGPVRISRGRLVQGASVAILVDESGSMAERDGGGLSRLDRAKAILAPGNPAALAELAEGRELAVFAFSDALRRLSGASRRAPSDIASDVRALKAEGKQTAPGGATVAALREFRGRPLAGVVVISDGRSTGGPDPETAGAEARAAGVPVFVVPIGSTRTSANLSLRNVAAPARAFEGDEIAVEAEIAHEGFEGRRARVSLLEGERIVSEQEVAVEAGRASRFSARFVPNGPGTHRYRIRIAHEPSERSFEDNEAAVAVEVVRDRTGILLVASGPSWEYRFLRNHWRRDRSIDLGCVLQGAPPDAPAEGSKPVPAVPARLEDLRAWDVILLLDPDPARLPAGFLEALPAFAGETGGGVLLAAGGPHSAKALANPALRKLLPVVAKPEALREAGRAATASERPFRIPPGGPHPILRQEAGDEATVAFWASAPGPFDPTEIERTKPGAEVLLFGGDSPWLVIQPYGAGRSAFLASAEAWRIRRAGEGAYHRFWDQAIRYLRQGRLQGSRERVSISAEKRSIALGERQRLFARAVRADFTPFPADAVLEAVLRVEGREAARVRLLPVAPGEFESEIVPAEAGVHEALLETPDAKASASFEVRLPRPEIEDVRADPEALAALARASGAEIVEPERFAEFCRTLA
ncbi:MAG: vWA domain-containing protein, partial [Planctomycetota bacterium]